MGLCGRHWWWGNLPPDADQCLCGDKAEKEKIVKENIVTFIADEWTQVVSCEWVDDLIDGGIYYLTLVS